METTTARELANQRWVCRGLAAFLVAGAWAALGYGLIFSPSDAEAWGDLEAGGRFGANFAVYLPFYALTLPVALVVLVGLIKAMTALSPLVVTAFGVAFFACWVSTNDYLFSAQP